MRINLPHAVLDQLADKENILVAGVGGGFDVFCGLPIYFTLRELGKTVHLANYSFSSLPVVSHYCETVALVPELLEGATADLNPELQLGYYPEGYLSQWFREEHDEEVTVWMFAKVGPQRLLSLYQKLVDHLEIDAIVLFDGGVDSVMIGDEAGAGTLLEDTIVLTAIEQLDVPVKLLGCLGFGAELEVAHNNALMNMSALIEADAFYGSCALVKQMPVYQAYEAASRYVWEQPEHHKSQINMRVVSAVLGHSGDFHLYHDYKPLPVFVSPLMSLYWFFDAAAVNQRSLLADAIRDTATIEDAYSATMALRAEMMDQSRPSFRLPY